VNGLGTPHSVAAPTPISATRLAVGLSSIGRKIKVQALFVRTKRKKGPSDVAISIVAKLMARCAGPVTSASGARMLNATPQL
jgi:hypothetical protein